MDSRRPVAQAMQQNHPHSKHTRNLRSLNISVAVRVVSRGSVSCQCDGRNQKVYVEVEILGRRGGNLGSSRPTAGRFESSILKFLLMLLFHCSA